VERIDDVGAVIGARVMGTTLVRWRASSTLNRREPGIRPGMTIGDTTRLGRLILNQIAHRRAVPPRRIQPWIRHHVEEIGNLEHLLPGLFRERADEEVSLD